MIEDKKTAIVGILVAIVILCTCFSCNGNIETVEEVTPVEEVPTETTE